VNNFEFDLHLFFLIYSFYYMQR